MERCAVCGGTENLEVDHKIPVIRGGLHIVDNFQCLCAICNRSKATMTDGEYLRKVGAC
jgi:5-methylcytosine-specific restriction endonuclease McrA